ncbi:hypothetical protein [Nocardia sp. CA-135398]
MTGTWWSLNTAANDNEMQDFYGSMQAELLLPITCWRNPYQRR